MTVRSLFWGLYFFILTACSHPMMKEDDSSTALQPSPSAMVNTGGVDREHPEMQTPSDSSDLGRWPREGEAGAKPRFSVPFDSDHIRFNLDERSWNKIADSDGIQAYEPRPEYQPFGDVLSFRGEAILPAPLAKIATILNTPGIQREWVDSLIEGYIAERISQFESIGYNKTSVPWPFQDRDFVYKIEVKVQVDPPVMLIKMKSQDYPGIPPQEGVVRGEILQAYFYMKELPGGNTRMVIEMALNPKGSIPIWLVNTAQKKWPTSTLSRLRELSKRPTIAVSSEIEEYFRRSKIKRGNRK